MTTARDTIQYLKEYHSKENSVPGDESEWCVAGDEWPCRESRLVAFTEAILDRADTYTALGTNIMLNPIAAAIYRDVATEILALAEQHLGGGES